MPMPAARIEIKTSRRPNHIAVDILFFAMWLADAFYVQASSAHFSDYMEYYMVYNGLKANYFELGYYYLGLLTKFLGLDFFAFRLIIVTATLLLMRDSILKYAKEPVWVAFLYMLHPFLIQCIQIRNALGVAIIIYGMRYLVKGRKGVFQYLVCVLIATLFHISSLLYAILVLVVYLTPSTLLKLSVCFLVVLETALFFFKKQLVAIVANVLHVNKILEYFSTTETRALTLSMLIYLVLYFVCVYIYSYRDPDREDPMDRILILSSILVLTYIPLMLIHYDYFRVYEYFYPVITMALFNYLHESSIQKWVYRILIKVGFLSITIYQGLGWLIDNNNEVLGNNIFFQWLSEAFYRF